MSNETRLEASPFPSVHLRNVRLYVCDDQTDSDKPIPHTVLFLGGLDPTAELELARKQFSCIRKRDLCQAEVASLLALLFRCAVQINRYVKGSMHIPVSPCRLPYKSPERLFILISTPTWLLAETFPRRQSKRAQVQAHQSRSKCHL